MTTHSNHKTAQSPNTSGIAADRSDDYAGNSGLATRSVIVAASGGRWYIDS